MLLTQLVMYAHASAAVEERQLSEIPRHLACGGISESCNSVTRKNYTCPSASLPFLTGARGHDLLGKNDRRRREYMEAGPKRGYCPQLS